MGVRTLVHYTEYHDGYVEDATIRETDDPTYPCGWTYSLHYGTLDDKTLLRYDNAHSQTKGLAMTTLKITLGDGDRLRDSALDRLEAAERGDDVAEVEPTLNFRTVADLAAMLTEKKLELLRTVASEEPESITEAAEVADRDYREVHRNLSELAALNVLDFEQDGRSKRPVVPYDSIEIDIGLDTASDTGEHLPAGAD